MTLQTRKPTGLPSWPIMLLAGREKAGKSWAAVAASASPLIGRTLYIGIGEDDPDEYALIPGADFEIVEHDGTYPGILRAVRDAVAEPSGDLPTLIIVDSGTRLWNLIGDNMQAIANRRANGKKTASGDYTISTDLWNVAANQWQDVMDALREHHGPTIITARLDPVTVMENGQPTKAKEWKVQAHKSLVFDATAIVEMRERGQFLITGVKSARVQLDKPKAYPDFTVDNLWDRLGLTEGTAVRTHATVRRDTSGAEPGAQGVPEGVPPQGRPAGPPPQVPPAQPAPAAPQGPTLEFRPPQQDWLVAAREARSRPQLRPVYQQAEAAGDLNVAVKNPAFGQEQDAPEYIALGRYLWLVRDALPERAPAAKKDPEPQPAEASQQGDAWAPVEPDAGAQVTEWPTADIPSGEESAA
ncbi:hypothetical protein Q9R08_05000 [Microbacterium sp. QXD-8]|uniref:AAA family ATPase n=1 Tax=Microbacterium psychrotolerans TaxID=3068321 RepID=A0ABU0YYC3_9MICO|nr:hypothetical protein [Microbacterium sp. QXD-8]MDQ7877330.1 hypothetical protein [Microbacterium sp. QXD-8]